MNAGAPRATGAPRAGGAEWDAATYHKVSDPQFRWGLPVLERLALQGDETVMDLGCGSGRLTALLLERLPRGRVLALDRSRNMLEEARAHLLPRFAGRVEFVACDLAALDLNEVADAAFSTATFHWVLDHANLFGKIARALRPGGRLVAQCGGGPNVRRLRDRAHALMAAAPYAEHFAGFEEPWLFAEPEATRANLEAAGFESAEAWLHEEPTPFPDAEAMRVFLERVVLHPYLERLPEPLARRFLDALVAQAAEDRPPFVLDYWRLNLGGVRSAAKGTRA